MKYETACCLSLTGKLDPKMSKTEIMHGKVVPHEEGACLGNINNERASE